MRRVSEPSIQLAEAKVMIKNVVQKSLFEKYSREKSKDLASDKSGKKKLCSKMRDVQTRGSRLSFSSPVRHPLPRL